MSKTLRMVLLFGLLPVAMDRSTSRRCRVRLV